MVQEAMHMSSSHLADEMREAEEELEEDSSLHDASNPQNGVALEILEEGRVSRGPLENTLSARTNSPAASTSRSASPRPTARGRQPSISLGAGVGPLKDASLLTRMRESSRNLIQMMTSPVFAQAFVLTFLGEWGDRSQITTIAMAGAHVSTNLNVLLGPV
jgi:putative Ca2+/H+ antiporter (TMEM165/GDT1 family)